MEGGLTAMRGTNMSIVSHMQQMITHIFLKLGVRDVLGEGEGEG